MMFWLSLLGVCAVALLMLRLARPKLPFECEASVQFEFHLAADEVWRRLEDFEHMPMAGRNARAVVRLADEGGLPAWTEDLGTTKVTVRTVERVQGRRLVRSLADATLPLTAIWTVELDPRSSGRTRVTMSNRATVRPGRLAGPLSLSIRFGGLRSGLRHFAKRLAGDATFGVAA